MSHKSSFQPQVGFYLWDEDGRLEVMRCPWSDDNGANYTVTIRQGNTSLGIVLGMRQLADLITELERLSHTEEA